MHSNSLGCPKIIPPSVPVLYWLWHLTCISSLKAKNERKTLIYTQLKISRYNPHFFAICRWILRNWPSTYLLYSDRMQRPDFDISPCCERYVALSQQLLHPLCLSVSAFDPLSLCVHWSTWHLRGLNINWMEYGTSCENFFSISLMDWMQMRVISYFSVQNNWLIWPLFLFIVGPYLLFGMPFTSIKQCFLSFQAAYQTHIFMPQFRIISTSVIQ